MSNKLPYSHLLYVRQYSIADNDDELTVFGVNTEDISHTMREFMYECPKRLKSITCVKCTQKILTFWKQQGHKIYKIKDKYTDVKM